MGINECVMCANFGDPTSRDGELRPPQKKTKKKLRFLAGKLFIRL